MKHLDISEEKRASIEKALETTFGTTSTDSAELLDGGLSSSLNYKIMVEGRPYVLRIIKNISPINDPKRRFACMRLAAEAGIAPKVYYANSDDAISIVGCVDAKPIREGFESKDLLLNKLADLIRSIHSLSQFPTLINFIDGVDLFIRQFNELNMFPEDVTAEVFTLYAEIQEHYPRMDMDLVASHNDLHVNNILYDGSKLLVIDWEAAFQNDRYVDLAIVAKSFVSGKKQEERYLNYYFGDTLTAYKKARYYLMQQVCHVYYAMLMFKFAAAMRPPDFTHDPDMATVPLAEIPELIEKGRLSLGSYEGRLLYGKTLLNEALNNMKRERFFESVELVQQGEDI